MSERLFALTAALQKIRWQAHAMKDRLSQGLAVADWELRMIVEAVDKLKATEGEDERLVRVRHTPVLSIPEEEIALLSPDSQEWARKAQAQHAREKACPGHEAEAEPVTVYQRMRGWHPAKCKHCGKDMSVDSGD